MATFVPVDPMDQYNQLLVENVHPADWVNPGPAERYNLVVLGAGSAGLVNAAGAAGSSKRCPRFRRAQAGGNLCQRSQANTHCNGRAFLVSQSRALRANLGLRT